MQKLVLRPQKSMRSGQDHQEELLLSTKCSSRQPLSRQHRRLPMIEAPVLLGDTWAEALLSDHHTDPPTRNIEH